jgi:hypothetical protein
MRYILVFATCIFLASCADRPLIGVTVSNSPDQRGACLPGKPGGGC